jgi:hypothetical protein
VGCRRYENRSLRVSNRVRIAVRIIRRIRVRIIRRTRVRRTGHKRFEKTRLLPSRCRRSAAARTARRSRAARSAARGAPSGPAGTGIIGIIGIIGMIGIIGTVGVIGGIGIIGTGVGCTAVHRLRRWRVSAAVSVRRPFRGRAAHRDRAAPWPPPGVPPSMWPRACSKSTRRSVVGTESRLHARARWSLTVSASDVG